MKNLLLYVAVLSGFFTLDVFAQRTIGNNRDPNAGNSGSRDQHGRSGESRPVENTTPAPPPTQVVYDPPPIHPCPPIIVDQPTCYVAPLHETVIIMEQPQVEEKPEVNEIVLRDSNIGPNRSGFDFSGGEVVSYNDQAVDVYFSTRKEGSEFVVAKDADIQDLGQIDSFSKLESLPSSEWSPMHRVHAEPANVYVVWTWDNQYYKFRVVSISDNRVSIEWMKMDGGSRIASNGSYRNGTTRRDNSLAKFGK